MLFLANMGGPSLLPDIKMALKRAKHFTKELPLVGPFTPVSRTGLSIPIRNGLWYLDLKEEINEEETRADLLCLHWMAKKINEYIDGHLIENDEEAKYAIAAWLMRMEEWGDWSHLDDRAFQPQDEEIPAPAEPERGITMQAAKFIYKQIVDKHKNGEDTSALDPNQMVEEQNLWLVDEWTHVGYCIMTCLDNFKLVESYKKGQTKILDTLIGKTIKAANMTVDAELVKDLMPGIIEKHF